MRSRIRSGWGGIRSLERTRGSNGRAWPDHRGVLPGFVKAWRSLEPVEANRTIARAHHKRLAAAVEFAAKIGTAELSRGSHGEVDRDLSIAGVRIEVGCEIFRKTQSDGTVASADPPRASHLRTGAGIGINAPIVGFKAQPVPAAGSANAAVRGRGFEI